MFAAWDDVAHVATLDGVVAVFVHQLIGFLHVAFVVADGGGGLVVHHQLDALRVGILIERLDVKVGVRGDEIENVVLRVAKPVLPPDVPALDEHLIEAVLGGEVDIAAHFVVVRRVGAVGLDLRVVRHADVYREKVVGVGPRRFARDHFPPNADIFHWLDP